jgi:hypothetical protein
MSVSEPFFTESVQLAIWQVPPLHFELVQSAPLVQLSPLAQSGHAAPPQSTSLSVPFLTLSVQVAALQEPEVQTPL